MPLAFTRIGLFAKHNNTSVSDTLKKLVIYLQAKGHTLFIETESNVLLADTPLTSVAREEIGALVDLIIVVGGDGSLLNAARAVVAHQIPVLGINRGRLGFLADILPHNMEQELEAIFAGQYLKEQRFLLSAQVKRHNTVVMQEIALNDIVLYNGGLARMIDFEVYVNDQFVLRQQADGIITATPTGSTAYGLSAGGPILFPTLNAITITPMCPHTLSNRPIVVDGNSQIKLVVTESNNIAPKLSYDGQVYFDLEIGDEILIKKHDCEFTLIHPSHHEYFSVLREKLSWNVHLLQD